MPSKEDLLVIDVDASFGRVTVERCARDGAFYNVFVNGEIKHGELTAEGAMGALAHYLHREGFAVKVLYSEGYKVKKNE